MNRYKSGLFGAARGPDPLEAFDKVYEREKSSRLLGRYGKPKRRQQETEQNPQPVVAEQSAQPAGRVVLKERLIRDWDEAPATPVADTKKTAPAPEPTATPVPAPKPQDELAAAPPPSAPDTDDDMPLVEAGSFSVQDGGTLPGDADLVDDIAHINEPRRPPAEGTLRDAAIDDFLAMIDKSYRPAPPSSETGGEVIEAQAYTADPIDLVADVAEMSAGEEPREIAPDITPISLPPISADMVAQESYARGADAVSAIGLGLAVFQEFKAELTTGNISVSAQPSRYVHPNTPPDSRFIEVVNDFVFHCYHPRIIVDDVKFKFRIRTEIDFHDIRHAKISFVASESDDLISSHFKVGFTATALSLPKENMCKIRYDFSGRWDPKGTGEYDFHGMIDVWADGSVHFSQMVTETDSPTFSSKKIKAVRIVSTRRVSEKPLPGMVRKARDHVVRFEKPKQSKLSDDQSRALKTFVDGIPKDDLSLLQQGRVPVVVEGFASTKGSISDNQALARDRRDAVVSFLKDHLGTNVVFTGKSHGELAADGPDDIESAEDRKATVRIFTFKNA